MAYIDLQTETLLSDDEVRDRFMPTIINRLDDVDAESLADKQVGRVEFVGRFFNSADRSRCAPVYWEFISDKLAPLSTVRL